MFFIYPQRNSDFITKTSSVTILLCDYIFYLLMYVNIFPLKADIFTHMKNREP